MDFTEIVAFMLFKEDTILAEQRGLDEPIDPGALVFPAGHVEAGESPEDAVIRETREELGVHVSKPLYVCTLLHRYREKRFRIHFFAFESWSGKIKNQAAEALIWLPLNDLSPLTYEIDRLAVREYERFYGNR